MVLIWNCDVYSRWELGSNFVPSGEKSYLPDLRTKHWAFKMVFSEIIYHVSKLTESLKQNRWAKWPGTLSNGMY